MITDTLYLQPSIECFRNNINEINRINKDTSNKYKLTNEIKKELSLHLWTLKNVFNV